MFDVPWVRVVGGACVVKNWSVWFAVFPLGRMGAADIDDEYSTESPN